MSYGVKRARIGKRLRAEVWAKTGGICYLCEVQINDGEYWEVEHELALALGGTNDLLNLFPAHKACHKRKTAQDRKLIAKSNRIRRRFGLDPVKRKPRKKIRSRGFQRGVKKKIASRPFQLRLL